jgi:ribosomal protein S18 acetylase RimI-like enzyme
VEDHDRIRLDLALDPEGISWAASIVSGGLEIKRQYAPSFAAAEMVGAARAPGQIVIRDGRLYPATDDRGINVRPASEDDKDFLLEVFSSSRRDELAAVGWPKEQQDAFLTMQFEIQTKAYAMQYPEAQSSVIMAGGEPAGRIIVDRSDGDITLTDIAVLPRFKRTGIATYLIKQLQNEAAVSHQPVVLHVEKVNDQALKLYEKLGFQVTGETDLHYEMKWIEK